MKFYDEIFLKDHTESAYQTVPPFPTMSLNPNAGWKWNYAGALQQVEFPSAFSIATYNLLHDTVFPFQKRADSVIDALANADADILCLQEVSDENLAVLLGSARIQSAYSFSSRDPAVTLENERNLMILSRFPFEYSMIDTGSTHKPACIATFNAESRGSPPLVVACIHLTAGRAASPLEQKHKELGSVVDHLKVNFPKADWVIIGDLNWPNEIHATPADDLFEDIGAPIGEPTYDPTRNWLAAKTARESKTGQRYDRIYLKRNGSWVGQDVGTFGVAEEPGSDHWGLKSFIRKPSDIAHAAKSEGKLSVHPVSSGTLPATSLSASHLDTLLRSEDWLPSLERERQMERALDLLRATLCSTLPAPPLDPESSQGKQPPRVIIRLEAVGSYALGTHSMSSDIDCLAVGNISSKTFWMLARSKIRARLLKVQAEGITEAVKLKRFVKDAVVQMMELEVCGIKVDLQYCAAAGLAEQYVTFVIQPDFNQLVLL
jgi:endonuclease/exonuclease/phosphatase family metal-dependent hydrolase